MFSIKKQAYSWWIFRKSPGIELQVDLVPSPTPLRNTVSEMFFQASFPAKIKVVTLWLLCAPARNTVCLSVCLFICLSVGLFVCMSFCLSVCLVAYLFIFLSLRWSIRCFVFVSTNGLSNVLFIRPQMARWQVVQHVQIYHALLIPPSSLTVEFIWRRCGFWLLVIFSSVFRRLLRTKLPSCGMCYLSSDHW